MTERCPQCGGLLKEGESCSSIFEELLALEFSDPAYGAVHFLTVSCFMIQHGQYSDEALEWIRPQLRAYLEDGRTGEQIRQQAQREANNYRRTWKVVRAAGAKPAPARNWSMTFVDVAGQYQDATGYCALVRQWARSTLDEMG